MAAHGRQWRSLYRLYRAAGWAAESSGASAKGSQQKQSAPEDCGFSSFLMISSVTMAWPGRPEDWK